MVTRLVVVAAAATLFGGIFGALTASTSVPASNAGQTVKSLSINEIAPPQCSGIALQDIIIGAGTINGTAGNDLILGSTGADTIVGNGGTDCILAGGGNDRITGNTRKSGANLVQAGDYCDGGGGTDTVTTVKVAGITYPTCDTTANVP
jgi:Ca2+-binding RTX toxin-like protein